MPASERFVFDTNTLVSAAIFRHSVPARALSVAQCKGDLVFSAETEDELKRVLSREKFDRYLTLSERLAFIAALMRYSVRLDSVPTVAACRDPRDDKFLALAVFAGSSALVTGDDDLLVLHPFRGIPIVQAGEFVRLFG
jgi:putative PIN family toxin of toxin-antitoxin system